VGTGSVESSVEVSVGSGTSVPSSVGVGSGTSVVSSVEVGSGKSPASSVEVGSGKSVASSVEVTVGSGKPAESSVAVSVGSGTSVESSVKVPVGSGISVESPPSPVSSGVSVTQLVLSVTPGIDMVGPVLLGKMGAVVVVAKGHLQDGVDVSVAIMKVMVWMPGCADSYDSISETIGGAGANVPVKGVNEVVALEEVGVPSDTGGVIPSGVEEAGMLSVVEETVMVTGVEEARPVEVEMPLSSWRLLSRTPLGAARGPP